VEEILRGRSVTLPSNGFASRSSYRKARGGPSYAFALVSVAAALEIEGETIKDVRLALDGDNRRPCHVLKRLRWRRQAESVGRLRGVIAQRELTS
jgi:CO/xanthine dehydrogenase FAD-binding subunit